jgi:hypothetical protein
MKAPRNYTAKELSAYLAEAGVTLTEETIRRRMHLWERQPAHVLAIPYLRQLGRPFRVPAEVAERLLQVAEVAA